MEATKVTNGLTRPQIFDDSQWNEGPAKFGYGGDGEVTTLKYGNDLNNKHKNLLFQGIILKLMIYPRPLSLLQTLVRDDGIIVYLNGKEVVRNKMPSEKSIIKAFLLE